MTDHEFQTMTKSMPSEKEGDEEEEGEEEEFVKKQSFQKQINCDRDAKQ